MPISLGVRCALWDAARFPKTTPQAELWKFSLLRETLESSSSASRPDISGHDHKNRRLEVPRLALPPWFPPEVISSRECPSFPARAASRSLILGPGRRVLPQWRPLPYCERRPASAVRRRAGGRQPGDPRGVEVAGFGPTPLTPSSFHRRSLRQPDPNSARSAAAAEGPGIALLMSRPSRGGQENLRA